MSARRRGVVLCGVLVVSLAACSGSEPPGALPTNTMTVEPSRTPFSTIPIQTSSATPTASPTPSSTLALDATPTVEALDLDGYAAELEAMVGQLTGHYGIVVAEPDGTPIYSHAAADQFEAASLYKLEVMVEVFRQREQGLLDFSEELYLDELYFAEAADDEGLNSSYTGSYLTVEELLYQMVDASSNAAAWALLDRVGTENVNASMVALGLSGTEIRWSPSGSVPAGDDEIVEETPENEEAIDEPLDEEPTVEEEAPADEETSEPEPEEDGAPEEETEEAEPSGRRDALLAAYASVDELTPNVTTAEDIGWLYAQLLQGLVVSPEASAEMLALLTDQQVNDRLPAYLPDGTVVAHKTGNLDGIVHDAGVIYAPAHEVIVVVLSDDVNPDEAIEFMAWLGELTYWFFS